MAGKGIPYSQMSRLSKAKAEQFGLQSIFSYGYRNKEDISNLPANTLVLGSQNVLTNAAELVAIRNGYALDGPAGNQNDYGIDSSYDFLNRVGDTINLRKWGTNLEVRYVNPVSNAVSWVTLMSTLTAAKPANFTSFWDQTTELKTITLFVNGGQTLYAWSGGVASFASATASQSGVIQTLVLSAGGSSYRQGDTITIVEAGGTGGTATVLSVNGSGAITAIRLMNPGSGYSNQNGLTTTSTSPTGGSGATVNITAVATGGSITISGSSTTSQLGFFDNATDATLFKLIINGVVYTYTSTYGNTFYGVTPDPSLASIAVGDPILQQNFSFTTDNISGLPAEFNLDLISTLANQVWYGDEKRNDVYVSKTNLYLDTTFSSPARLPSEGAQIVLDEAPVGFSPQSSQMYITAGKDQWWISQTLQQTVSTTVAGNTIATPTESLYAVRLKTALNQAAQSQGLIGRFKNALVYVSNEQIINALGLVQNIQQDPQVVNMSDPIKFDVDAYDFTGGQVEYDNYYIYVSVPVNGVVRMYNVQKQYWEAPQLIPVSRFYHTTSVVGASIYGHSSLTNESYQLFTGFNDNGNPINSVLAFPYVCVQGGSPFEKKVFTGIYTEGYIQGNTSLMLTINYDFGGYSGTYTTLISGADQRILFNKVTDGSIGRNSLGTEPIGSILNVPNAPAIPKFRVINTMPPVPVYEYQIVYSSDDVDQDWSILRTGPAATSANDTPFEITQ